MCTIQAVYFNIVGSPVPGITCSTSQNSIVSTEVDATFAGAEIGQQYVATTFIKKPDNTQITINSPPAIASSTAHFISGNLTTPITPIGAYTILSTTIYEYISGNAVCSGTISGGKCQSITITTLGNITISPTIQTVWVGNTYQLRSICKDQSGNTITWPLLTWSSSNSSVATVSSTGLVTGVSPGTANITASSSGIMSNLSILTVTPRALPGLMDSSWPKFHCDLKNTGLSSHPSVSDGTLKWTFPLGDSTFGSPFPAVSSDGTIYIGSGDLNYSFPGLYAINPDGTLKWTFPVGYNTNFSSPAISSDGTIYIGSGDRRPFSRLHAINPDGTLKWTSPRGGSPTIGLDGTIYVGSNAINPDGTSKWVLSTGASTLSSPAIGSDNTIYASGGGLYAINPDGTLKWVFASEAISTSPSIGPDGTIYISGNSIYAINPNGTLKWTFAISSNQTPSIGPDGTIYVPGGDGKLYAINPDGTLKWNSTINSGSSPAIGYDDTIYLGNYAINPDGTLKWTSPIGGRSTVIGPYGTIYVVSGNHYGNLCALSFLPMTISPSNITMTNGQTQQFTVSCKDQNGNPTACPTITWNTTDHVLGTITSTGLFTALASSGIVTITAANGTTTGSTTVTLLPPPLTSIDIIPIRPSVTIGTTLQLEAMCKDHNNNIIMCPTLTWSSSYPSIGSISPSTGTSTVITGISAGSTTITAANNGTNGTTTVTVTTQLTLASIDISPLSSTKAVGDSQIFTAIAKTGDNSIIPGVSITWLSNDTLIGTVSPMSGITDSNGQTTTTFTALSEGSAIIIVSSGIVTNLATITVTGVQEAGMGGGAGMILVAGLGITALISMKSPIVK
jgi:uncharacterized protein YjdB